MIKIAVCDDEESFRSQISKIVREYFEEDHKTILLLEYKEGAELLNAHIRFDIIFLDIEMPQYSGIETAVKLRELGVYSKIIFVTNYSNYKNHAYKVHAFDYITKPIDSKIIYRVLEAAINFLNNEIEKPKVAFKTKEGIVTLKLDDIFYFEYLSRQVIIKSSKGIFHATYKLSEVYEKMKKYNFESPHKSYIVNLLHIKCIEKFDVLIDNGQIIPLAQKRAVEFKRKFNDFLQSTFDKI